MACGEGGGGGGDGGRLVSCDEAVVVTYSVF